MLTQLVPGNRFASLYPQPARVVESDYVCTPPGFLEVSPLTALAISGNVHGPFSPLSRVYTVSNTGPLPLDWTVQPFSDLWHFSKQGGTLNPGQSDTTTGSLDLVVANSLPAGTYVILPQFVNSAYPANRVEVRVTLSITTPP
jgi:hypothetical protein